MKLNPELVESYWKSGRTLPLAAGRQLLHEAQEIANDRGVNVLVDLAHQCNFTTMCKFQAFLIAHGYRYIGTRACLNTRLTQGAPSRVRTVYGTAKDGRKIRPFVMWPNREYNVLVTMQANPDGT